MTIYFRKTSDESLSKFIERLTSASDNLQTY